MYIYIYLYYLSCHFHSLLQYSFVVCYCSTSLFHANHFVPSPLSCILLLLPALSLLVSYKKQLSKKFSLELTSVVWGRIVLNSPVIFNLNSLPLV